MLLFVHFMLGLVLFFSPVKTLPSGPLYTNPSLPPAMELMEAAGLNNYLQEDAVEMALRGYHTYGNQSDFLVIADFTKAGKEQRLYVIDMKNKCLMLKTWVAHGRNSGLERAVQFSNQPESHMSSKGFYRIGETFVSPKHGPALALDGLQQGLNNNARMREIIIHGADYVNVDFINQHGYCGRSHGCPALSREAMKELLSLAPEGSLLYIHSN